LLFGARGVIPANAAILHFGFGSTVLPVQTEFPVDSA